MATPKIIADFETQLSTSLSIGDMSFSLSSATDDDGVALPTGKYYFTIDNGTSQKEYVVGTLTGTSVASVSNVTRQGAESSGVVKAHRIGASVIMTDFLTYKNYIDETTIAGAADASTIVKGLVETATLAEVRAGTATGSTGAVLAVTPDVLDDLPTEDEKAALAGNVGTPSSSNTFITEEWLAAASDVGTFTSSGIWTKDSGLVRVKVQAWGAGGSGGATTSAVEAGGGGGGAYIEKWYEASELGATETVTIGAGGASRTTASSGANGGNTTFGSLLTAYGGEGGLIGSGTAGGDGGDYTGVGGAGNAATAAASAIKVVFHEGGGGGGATSGGLINSAGSAYWGGGGGGAASGDTNSEGGGGGSRFGGVGGAGQGAGGTATGVAGAQPGGGGGAAASAGGAVASGAGGGGKVIITEYYS